MSALPPLTREERTFLTGMIGLKFVLVAVAAHAGLTAVALVGVAIFIFGL
jgi:hypothetical protein